MTAPEPSQPLTDAELARIRVDLAADNVALHDAWLAGDAQTLLAEVDRLRSENTAVKTQRDQFQKMMNSAVSAGVIIDGERLDALRERDALQGQLDEARELHQPLVEGGQGWDGNGNYTFIKPCCPTCGTSDEYAVRWPCSTAKALGLDQSEEGQANG